MDLTLPGATTTELAAAFLQAAITLGIAGLCVFLYGRYRKRHFAFWAVAWTLYALRLGAIISFLVGGHRSWLYWHQVITGWTALALLWAALVFSQQLRWRHRYGWLLVFPPAWSYVAIYQLDNFLWAAGPAVLFLSAATVWTGWVFLRYHRQVRSSAALGLAIALFLWGAHHLDYPFLRARGAWNPWGYYLDITFVLAMGGGILMLVLEDVQRGLETLSSLSGDLQLGAREDELMDALLGRLLDLPAVRGSAVFLGHDGGGMIVRGRGACRDWVEDEPRGAAAAAIERVRASGRPEVERPAVGRGSGGRSRSGPGEGRHPYVAALPIFREAAVVGAIVIVGDARDPFAALDRRFLVTLGRQVGAALERAELLRRLGHRTEELERLATRMVHQTEEERRRLSRELHDETAQVLSAVKLQLGLERETAAPELADRLARILSLVDSGIASIRSVTNDLRPTLLDDLGFLPALRALAQSFGERSALDVRLRTPAELPPLSDEAELALFRALQEALSNTARHAGADGVDVTLGVDDGFVRLEVRDNGRGMPDLSELERSEREGRMGLAGMRERVTLLGGDLTLRGGPEDGAVVAVRVPVQRTPP